MPRDGNAEQDNSRTHKATKVLSLLPPLQSHYVTSATSLAEKGFTSAHLKDAAMEVRYSPRKLQLHMVAAADEACLHRLAQVLMPAAEICSSRNKDSIMDKSLI
ncbi:hypothetical protein llap_3941 [Limosa lapponica baueri]|uniref:Uncharacterized protein n=1 Tax=Limosa lapponica baueri TaxID=1758121 RepID=A0A2I0UI77_LIMLA|nr:hypothetical protein llap_3941 [Limosa lapponica baueri]